METKLFGISQRASKIFWMAQNGAVMVKILNCITHTGSGSGHQYKSHYQLEFLMGSVTSPLWRQNYFNIPT